MNSLRLNTHYSGCGGQAFLSWVWGKCLTWQFARIVLVGRRWNRAEMHWVCSPAAGCAPGCATGLLQRSRHWKALPRCFDRYRHSASTCVWRSFGTANAIASVKFTHVLYQRSMFIYLGSLRVKRLRCLGLKRLQSADRTNQFRSQVETESLDLSFSVWGPCLYNFFFGFVFCADSDTESCYHYQCNMFFGVLKSANGRCMSFNRWRSPGQGCNPRQMQSKAGIE